MAAADHSLSDAVRRAYRRGEQEETMPPLVRVDSAGRPVGRVADGDAVIFYDIRGEREIELTAALTASDFAHFPRGRAPRLDFVTLVEYDPELRVSVAFPPAAGLPGVLAEVVSRAGRGQVKVTESEKATHLGYFLNGKRKAPFPGEERVVIPSPEDPLAEPEMRADEVAEALAAAVADARPALVVGNFPNVDVVGHSENRAAILRAVEAVDRALARVLAEARRRNVAVVVVADHGTVERWLYPEGAIDTGHTASPVPLAVVFPDDHPHAGARLAEGGSLSDVAPTVLDLLGLPAPGEMTGRSLLAPPRTRAPGRVALVVCDGWGVAEPGPGNLIAAARTPTMDSLLRGPLATTLRASGAAVGLPEGAVGNSEAGHLHIGAGRIVASDKVRIQAALDDGSFHANPVLRGAMEDAVRRGARVHLLGIVSFFSSHGSLDHLFALLELGRRVGARDVFVHALLGRRGERPESGAHYLELVEKEIERLGVGQLVSVIGRHWALDREQNWDRIEKTYRMLVDGDGEQVA